MLEERKVRPAHPGEILADLLEENEISQTEFAKHIGVSRRTVNQIINGSRSITVDVAFRLSKAFGGTHQLWLNLQQQVDAWDALQLHKQDYDQIPLISSQAA